MCKKSVCFWKTLILVGKPRQENIILWLFILDIEHLYKEHLPKLPRAVLSIHTSFRSLFLFFFYLVLIMCHCKIICFSYIRFFMGKCSCFALQYNYFSALLRTRESSFFRPRLVYIFFKTEATFRDFFSLLLDVRPEHFVLFID